MSAFGTIVRGLPSTAREALAASCDGVKVADEGATLAADADRALVSILSGIDEVNLGIREVSRSTLEQVTASQTLAQSIGRVNDQGRVIAVGAIESLIE